MILFYLSFLTLHSFILKCKPPPRAWDDMMDPFPAGIMLSQQAYVAGGWRDASDKRMIQVFGPAAGSAIGTVPRLSRTDVADAIVAAQRAQPWDRHSPTAVPGCCIDSMT